VWIPQGRSEGGARPKAPTAVAGTLERAVALAAASGLAEPVVLLSPACASFDQYPNFEVRGTAFRELVLGLPGVTPMAAG
jgi:UDP-N-acetylmuramoylalanine--D-glutamate ligase